MSSDRVFEVTSKLGRKIRMSKAHWEYIVGIKHPSMRGMHEFVKRALTEPIEIRRSKRDPTVHLFYGRSGGRLLCCTVAKFLNGEGFVITAYLTGRMVGDSIWKRR